MEKKMYNLPLISVIVPIYNLEKYLVRCLNSLAKQSYQKLEFVLIDDGSLDNSLKICNKYTKQDNRFFVHTKENGGVTLARKFGLDKANGEFIIFCDGDDSLPTNAVELLYNNLSKQGADIAIGGCEIFKGNKVINSLNKIVGLLPKNEYIRNLLNFNVSIGPNARIYKKELFLNFPFGLSSKITNYEDFFANISISMHVNQVYISNEIVYNYYIRKGTASSNVMPYQLWVLLCKNIQILLEENLVSSKFSKEYNNMVYSLLLTNVIYKFQKVGSEFHAFIEPLFFDPKNLKINLFIFSSRIGVALSIFTYVYYVFRRFRNLVFKIRNVLK